MQFFNDYIWGFIVLGYLYIGILGRFFFNHGAHYEGTMFTVFLVLSLCPLWLKSFEDIVLPVHSLYQAGNMRQVVITMPRI